MAKKTEVKKKVGHNRVEIVFVSPKFAGAQNCSVYTDRNGKLWEYKINGRPARVSVMPPKQRFDLDRPDQKAMWEFLKGDTTDLKDWMGHPFLHPDRGVVKFVEEVTAAKNNNLFRKRKRELENKLDELAKDPIQLANFSRLVGLDPDLLDQEVIIDKITLMIDGAYDDPQFSTDRIEKLLSDADLDYRMVIAKALNFKVLEEREETIYYNETPIAATVDRAILWLKDNEKVFEAIKEACDEPVSTK